MRVACNTAGKHGRATEHDVIELIRELSKVCRDLTLAATLNRLATGRGRAKRGGRTVWRVSGITIASRSSRRDTTGSRSPKQPSRVEVSATESSAASPMHYQRAKWCPTRRINPVAACEARSRGPSLERQPLSDRRTAVARVLAARSARRRQVPPAVAATRWARPSYLVPARYPQAGWTSRVAGARGVLEGFYH